MSPLWLLLTLLPVLGGAERFNCKTRILGAYYADAKSGCKAFHVCVRVAGGGVRDFRFFCPPGTLFHQEAQTCTDGGDDDPLACPADIYDGQFDLYRIGSGFDTKKLSSAGNQEDETEYGLQRAETGDRRLSKNIIQSSAPVSDLRAAHSSDFFTGQRDRGRDEPQSVQLAPSAPQAPAPFSHHSQPAPPAPIVPQVTPAQPRQSFRRPTTYRTTTTQYTTPPSPSPLPSKQPNYETSKRKLTRKRPIHSQNKSTSTTFTPYVQPQQSYNINVQDNGNRRLAFQNKLTTPNLPPQFKEYKEEYVEVSRVTPKPNRFYPKDPSSPAFPQQSVTPNFNKKEGVAELYNYEALSTPGLNGEKENRPFNVKNNYNAADVPKEPTFERNKNNNFNNRAIVSTTVSYNSISDSNTTPSYRAFNSVPYEPEKSNFVPYSKKNYFQNPTISTTTTTVLPSPPANLNTVAYNTNIGFNVQSNNFADSEEDDGQYRPPQGEDDGLYRPELYEKELLSGAHSINIAASGNRLAENKKTYSKPQKPVKVVTQPAAQITQEPEVYTTAQVPYTIKTQRTFDYYKTYTTTSRPTELTGQNLSNDVPAQSTATSPRNTELRRTRPQNKPTTFAPVTISSQPTTRPPHVAKPFNNKDDTSYDYAYYDTDPGFSEYDHNLEFGRTKTRA